MAAEMSNSCDLNCTIIFPIFSYSKNDVEKRVCVCVCVCVCVELQLNGGFCSQVWQPGVDALEEGEELQFDPEAYNYLRGFSTGWPCLR